jgi:CheY-like chemotaxis protein
VVDAAEADVVLIDVSYPEMKSFHAIEELTRVRPEVRFLAWTADPPPHADVARAIRAGALGFVDTHTEGDEYASAIRTVHGGEAWLPPEDSRAILASVAEDLDVTVAEQRSRLFTVAVALVPVTGALAALWSLLIRQYFGHLGVRPVDLAIDPTTRVVDAIASVSLFLGVFGPLLYIKTWLDLLEPYADRLVGGSALVERRKLMAALVAFGTLAASATLAWFADLVVIAFIGPMVGFSLLADTLDLRSQLPPWLRITGMNRRRVMAGGGILVFAFLSILSTEVLVLGPDLQPDGAHGIIAPRVLGIGATPVLHIDVDDARPPKEVLYLGGNADLYVLVDPCDDDAVEYRSVGSSRLEVIDEVTCN